MDISTVVVCPIMHLCKWVACMESGLHLDLLLCYRRLLHFGLIALYQWFSAFFCSRHTNVLVATIPPPQLCRQMCIILMMYPQNSPATSLWRNNNSQNFSQNENFNWNIVNYHFSSSGHLNFLSSRVKFFYHLLVRAWFFTNIKKNAKNFS